MELAGKRVLVVGLGESGLAMARWVARQGAAVRVVDSRERPPNVDALHKAVPNAELVAGPFVEASFESVDLIAVSPGVPVQTPVLQAAATRGVPVISEVELFAWAIRVLAPQAKVIAITGSNGKTTTTALAAHLLNSAGMPAIACGNISPSVLDALMSVVDGEAQAPAVWVLELSSFQLETTYTLSADAATVLNISEDHLDRYAGMPEYAVAKERVFQGHGTLVINRDDAYNAGFAARAGSGRRLVSFGLQAAPGMGDYGIESGWITRGTERLIALDSMKLVGLHNAANAMAALALCEAVGAVPRTMLPGLAEFASLPHRVELVAEIDGVSYYDDSKGTNVGSTLAAVQGMGRKVAIILGGEGKEQDFSPLKPALTEHARAVALIGRDAGIIGEAIAGWGAPMERCSDMESAVRWCAAQALPGDAVLLSPACASFDMFRNYAHRAQVFVEAVRSLQRSKR